MTVYGQSPSRERGFSLSHLAGIEAGVALVGRLFPFQQVHQMGGAREPDVQPPLQERGGNVAVFLGQAPGGAEQGVFRPTLSSSPSGDDELLHLQWRGRPLLAVPEVHQPLDLLVGNETALQAPRLGGIRRQVQHIDPAQVASDVLKSLSIYKTVPKLLIRFLSANLVVAREDVGYASTNLLYHVKSGDESDFLCAVLCSRLINLWYRNAFQNDEVKFPHVQKSHLERIPIRRIKFTTPEKERKQLLERSKELYQEYLGSGDWSQVLAFVGDCLPQKADGSPDTEREKSDVVHDLLAFLAEEMTRLNKENQSRIRAFLTWLEKEILKGSVEDQKNKTRIKDFHNNIFEDLLDMLKKNKVVPDPCPSNVRDTIAGEFSTAVNALAPLKARLKATDDLIDQVVYRLYGLTEKEIAIVEGSV